MTDPQLELHHPLPWTRAQWDTLWRARQAGRLPHALLISGLPGVGKRSFAEALTRAVLCSCPGADGLACGVCADCHLLNVGNHPDRLALGPDPDGKSQDIRVDAVRALVDGEALTSYRGRYKVVWFDPAHRLNRAAANSLLKTLEEPSPATLMILISAEPSRLPATIRSRCQRIDLALPKESVALTWLAGRVGDEDPLRLLRLASGAPLRALAYLEDGVLARRDECLASFHGILGGVRDPVTEAGAWNGLEPRLLCYWLSSWISDLLRLAVDPGCVHLANPDRRAALLELVRGVELVRAHRVLQRVFRARAIIDTPVNKQLLFESLLIDLAHLNPETG